MKRFNFEDNKGVIIVGALTMLMVLAPLYGTTPAGRLGNKSSSPANPEALTTPANPANPNDSNSQSPPVLQLQQTPTATVKAIAEQLESYPEVKSKLKQAQAFSPILVIGRYSCPDTVTVVNLYKQLSPAEQMRFIFVLKQEPDKLDLLQDIPNQKFFISAENFDKIKVPNIPTTLYYNNKLSPLYLSGEDINQTELSILSQATLNQ